jgi:membrane-associated phospholipid phosphatase
MRSLRVLCVVVAAFGFWADGYAQQSQGLVDFSKQFARDEANLWTSPLRAKRKDLKWIVPIGFGTAALLRTDRSVSGEFGEVQRIQPPSRFVSRAGSLTTYAAPAALILLGHVTKNDRAAHAGSVSLQAVLHSAIIVQTLKAATNRERPNKPLGDGGFWDGGKSFPSGHAISSWAFAAAMSDQYPDKKLLRIGVYSMATAVSLSRISGREHFPSDVLIGSSVGYLIGHYISRHH